ncbi:MAG: glycosyltransferase family 2 protein [Proteobacteria bacterium]|nr:glycosyltransferase family 2 protein [Pseudomonadota bacterium]
MQQAEPAGRPRLSVVIPCFNEEDCLGELCRRVTAACVDCVAQDYELVLVNDGSGDGTWAAIAELARQDARVVGVDLSRNHGHQLALTAGLTVCQGERVLIIDADLQDPPELVGAMMQAMDQEGADVVYGQRRERAGETAFKKASAALFYRVLRSMTDVDIPLDTGDFRLISRRALEALLAMPEQHRFVRGMVSWIGFHQTPLLYDRAERFSGVTKYPLSKMVRFALDAITGFSIRPLRLASYFGLLLAVPAFLLLVYTLYSWLAGHTVQGWTSLMVVVLFLGSAQMIVLGVFGEYVGRLYMEAKRRPLFVIRAIVGAARRGGASHAVPRLGVGPDSAG